MSEFRWMHSVFGLIILLLLADIFALALLYLPSYLGLDSPLVQKSDLAAINQTQIVATDDQNLLFGNIRIKTEDNLLLPKIIIYNNGLKVGNLGTGQLLLRVYENDVLTIDSRDYQRQIRLDINTLSSNIKENTLPKTLYLDGQKLDLAAIRFK